MNSEFKSDKEYVNKLEKLITKLLPNILRQETNNIRQGVIISISKDFLRADVVADGKQYKHIPVLMGQFSIQVGDTVLIISPDPKNSNQNFAIAFSSSSNNNVSSCSLNLSDNIMVPTATFFRIPFNVVQHDLDSNWDIGEEKFIPKKKGVYSISLGSRFDNLAVGTNIIISVYKSGSEFRRAQSSSSVASDDPNPNLAFSTILNDSSDYLEFYARHTHGSDSLLNADSRITYASVDLLQEIKN